MRHAAAPAGRQHGMGMIELLVVILISMFMMAGLLSIVYGTRQNFTAQNQLSQLQDSERLATTIIANVLQQAGYYPNPATPGNSPTYFFPAVTVTNSTNSAAFVARQVVSSGSVTTQNQIWVRYTTSGSDDIMDCNGVTQTAQTNLTNYLYVNGGVLYCQAFWNGTAQTAQPLVAGVTSMNVLYGVNTGGSTPPAADTYMTQSQVAAGPYWNSVVSIQVTLVFNPNAIVTIKGSSGANVLSGLAPHVTRTVDLLNHV
jgi:type IV pilus assembly protein PilW